MKNNYSPLTQKIATLVLSSLVAIFTPFLQGATVTVNIVGDSFMPQTVTINVGDTVTWSGLVSAHNVTGMTAGDASDFCGSLGSFGTETSCSHTFTAAGTFPYECTIHAQCCGMTGTVIVNAASAPPPTVSITNPAPGAVFSAPANLKLGATAAESGGTVTNVTFFASTGGTPSSLGTITTSPFKVTGSSLSSGNYALTAVATAGGISTTSSVVNVSVVAPVALSNSVPVVSGQHFSFNYSATVGLTYVIQRSADLSVWSPVFTNVAASGLPAFTDSAVLGAANYYRVVLQPNP